MRKNSHFIKLRLLLPTNKMASRNPRGAVKRTVDGECNCITIYIDSFNGLTDADRNVYFNCLTMNARVKFNQYNTATKTASAASLSYHEVSEFKRIMCAMLNFAGLCDCACGKNFRTNRNVKWNSDTPRLNASE